MVEVCTMKKFVLVFIWLFFAIACQARIITVDNDSPADFNNIQDATDSNSAVYLLITNESLRDAFQPLVDRRTAQGKQGRLITIEIIRDDPNYAGADIQEEIRNCIKDHYLNHGTQWVCLGGDDTIIPIRYCLPRTTYGEVPADIYYADLDGGSWDLDSDGIYGEPGDVTETDLTPEVYYGRIPAATSQQVTDYINKVTMYESVDPDGFANSWLYVRRGKAEGQRLSGNDRPDDFPDYDPYPEDKRDYYREDIQPYWQATPAHFFADGFTSWDQQFYGDYPLNAANLVDVISSGYHHIAYSGHGWKWHLEKGNFGPDHILQLTNTIPCIVRSGGCSSAAFDQAYQNHREIMMPDAFLFNPNGGAVIFFGYCRTTGSGAPQEQLWEEIFKNNIRNSGEAFAAMKRHFAPSVVNDPYYQYIYVFLGDPAIDFMQDEPDRNLHMDSPAGCEVFDIQGDLVIWWSAAGNGFGPGETVRFEYSDDSGSHWYAVPEAEAIPYNDQTFTWEKPSLPEGQTYRMRIVSNAQPSVWAQSRTDFSIRRLGLLTVTSTPFRELQVWGTHPNRTNYTFTVIIGNTVTLEATQIDELTFVGWKNKDGILLCADRIYSFDFFVDTELTIEYAYLGPEIVYYVNDDTPENGIAPGDDDNNGLTPQTPMRHIQALLDKYPELGWGDVINTSIGTYTENILINDGYIGLTLRGADQDTTIIDGNQNGPCLKLVEFGAGAITGFTFTNGSDARGGGIWNQASSPTISQCTLLSNDGGSYGGGIYNASNSMPLIRNCTFIANRAWRGGGMCNRGTSESRIIACTFRANTSDSRGGAIYNTENCSPKIANCIFAGNKSGSVGGAIANAGNATTFINNATFTKNKANNGGGVFSGNNIHVTVTNSIFWDNTPTEISVSTPTAIVMYCDVQGGFSGIGNIDADPCFVDPGYWDSNGTPTDTTDDFWVNGDYHLKSEGWRRVKLGANWTWDNVTSRCIDAGNPGSMLGDEAISIPRDPNNLWGENLRINMGAYGGTAEASMPPYDWALLADLSNDGLVNWEDYAFQATDWLNPGDSQPGDLNRNGVVDLADIALLAEDWLKQTTWHE